MAEETQETVWYVRTQGQDQRLEDTKEVPSSGPVFKVSLTYQVATQEPKDWPSGSTTTSAMAPAAQSPETDPPPGAYSDRFEIKLEIGGLPAFSLDSRVGFYLPSKGGFLFENGVKGKSEDVDLSQQALESGSSGPTTLTVAATNVGDARYPTEVKATCKPYPFYELRFDDKDGARRWGGEERPSGTTPCYTVTQLQKDLQELGFALVSDASGSFGLSTEWAVREFQIYSKMENVAQDPDGREPTSPAYLTSLGSVGNAYKYQGELTGRVNERTYLLIQHWKRKKLRCPVVIVAKNPHTLEVKKVNLWGKDDVAQSSPRMYAYDFTAGLQNSPKIYTVGDWREYWVKDQKGNMVKYTGTACTAEDHAEKEILPEDWGVPSGEEWDEQEATCSTFKVVRAVADLECGGHFDSVNAYDDAFVSLGPCHWTLGTGTETGELGGFLAFAKSRGVDPFQGFGATPFLNWTDDGENLRTEKRTYNSPLAILQDMLRKVMLPVDKEMFQGWHWLYRIVRAGRTDSSFQRVMGTMVRLRIRDILSCNWGEEVSVSAAGSSVTVAPKTIGDVFTSEKAVAYLLRWHIKRPAHIVGWDLDNKVCQAGTVLREAVEDLLNAAVEAGLSERIQDLKNWTRLEEGILLRSLESRGPGRGVTDLSILKAWPAGANGYLREDHPEIQALSEVRDSFLPDYSDLPDPLDD